MVQLCRVSYRCSPSGRPVHPASSQNHKQGVIICCADSLAGMASSLTSGVVGAAKQAAGLGPSVVYHGEPSVVCYTHVVMYYVPQGVYSHLVVMLVGLQCHQHMHPRQLQPCMRV